jgi:hypothetical protein
LEGVDEYSRNCKSTSGCSGAVGNGMEAVRRMKDANVGAVVVLDGEVLQRMFSERDLMLRIVLGKKDPEKTAVQGCDDNRLHRNPQGHATR